jgi:hypothetical protein
MRKLIAITAAAAALTALAPVVTSDIAAAKSKAKSTESAPAPSKATASEGAATGEKGSAMPGASGAATNQAWDWDETYKTDKAQEQQLKAGASPSRVGSAGVTLPWLRRC